MTTPVFRTFAPIVVAVMIVFSIHMAIGGPMRPGGGLLGGLIAAAALAVHAMAAGGAETRRALRLDPLGIAAFGLVLGVLSGVFGLLAGAPFMAVLRFGLAIADGAAVLSTALLLDLAAYLAVFGTLSAAILALDDADAEEGR